MNSLLLISTTAVLLLIHLRHYACAPLPNIPSHFRSHLLEDEDKSKMAADDSELPLATNRIARVGRSLETSQNQMISEDDSKISEAQLVTLFALITHSPDLSNEDKLAAIEDLKKIILALHYKSDAKRQQSDFVGNSFSQGPFIEAQRRLGPEFNPTGW